MRRGLALLAVLPALAWGAAEAAERLALRREAAAFYAREGRGNFELYAVGDSTAWGVPYGVEANIAALVARRFGGRLGGRRIVVRVLAEPGATSTAQFFALRKALAYRDAAAPAAALVYCGHNDRAAFDTPPAPAAARLLARLGRRSFVLGDLYVRLGKRRWLAPHRDLALFEEDLRAMLDASLESGAVPLLATAVSNQADVDPRLYPADGLTLAQTRELLDRGERLEAAGAPGAAAALYAGAAARSRDFAPYAKFRLGRLSRARGRFADARRAFEEASDEDFADNFGRATRAQNEIVRRLAAERGLPAVDAVAAFRDASPHGLLGLSLFSDGHHPNMAGRLLLARAYARALSGYRREPEAPALDGERAAFAALGLDERRRAAALVYSAKWWLCSAARQADPRLRLDMAERRFDEALALDPGDAEAWLGRGLLELERAAPWLSDEDQRRWFRARGVDAFVTDDYRALSDRAVGELLDKMRRAGVSARTLRRIAETRAADAQRLRFKTQSE